MKSIGPYVISATPPGAVVNGHAADRAAESAPVRPPNGRRSTDRPLARSAAFTRPSPAERADSVPADSAPMHGLDRLTGMPVLLHRLPEFLVPAAIPTSAYLLPVFEVDIWDGQAYAVTELPLAAVPATYPDSAALGALRGLVALHGAGQIHGGLNAGQLWQIGREVRLAGAGLPWQPEASADDDLEALGRALDTLGVRPAALDSLETMSAVQALEALETALAEQDRRRGAVPSAPTFSPPVAVQQAAQAAMPVAPPPELSVSPATPVFVPAISVPEPEHPSHEKLAPETLSRYRSADDVIVIAEAVPGLATPLPEASTGATLPHISPSPEASAPTSEPAPFARTPIRIGFDEPPVALLDWTPADQPIEDRTEQPDVRARLTDLTAGNPQPGVIPRTSEEPKPNGSERFSEVVLPRSAPPVPTEARRLTRAPGVVLARPAETLPSTSVDPATPANRSQPLRIGWEEDHSWRVVKSGPERRRVSAPRLPSGTPRLVLLALVLLVGAGFWYWYFGQGGAPAAGCCTQSFTVSGSSEVKVTLVQAPPGSPLQPGALIGTAPGTLKFQGVPGSYTLKFSAAGHRAFNSAVRVPSEQPFGIVLK